MKCKPKLEDKFYYSYHSFDYLLSRKGHHLASCATETSCSACMFERGAGYNYGGADIDSQQVVDNSAIARLSELSGIRGSGKDKMRKIHNAKNVHRKI